MVVLAQDSGKEGSLTLLDGAKLRGVEISLLGIGPLPTITGVVSAVNLIFVEPPAGFLLPLQSPWN